MMHFESGASLALVKSRYLCKVIMNPENSVTTPPPLTIGKLWEVIKKRPQVVQDITSDYTSQGFGAGWHESYRA